MNMHYLKSQQIDKQFAAIKVGVDKHRPRTLHFFSQIEISSLEPSLVF